MNELKPCPFCGRVPKTLNSGNTVTCLTKQCPARKFSKAEKWNTRHNRWISVEDRLPEFSKAVLCFCRIYGRYIGIYEPISDTEFGQWSNFNGESGILPPTHWQELPEPPANK